MANLSEKTRAQQVLDYLKERTGEWVDGPEISNEKVGGSEGLRRLREKRIDLAMQGLKVETRKHPDASRDIWQYRMVEGTPGPAALPTELPKYTRAPTKLAFGEAIPCPKCDGKGKRIDPHTRKQGPCTRCNGFGIVPVPTMGV